MDTKTTEMRNLALATDFLLECLDPPRPGAFSRFTTDERAHAIFTAFAVAFADARFQVAWTVADERRVVIGGVVHATHLGPWRGVPATGKGIAVMSVLSFVVVDGLVIDVSVVTDSLGLAEQIGAVAPLGPRACERAQS